MSFEAALDALADNDGLSSKLGKVFVETFVTLKRDECARYAEQVPDPSTRDVTDWELEEYIEDY
jgi:glutamine synthetase